MKIRARIIAKYGINLFNFLLRLLFIYLPAIAAANITGNVPKPNNAINNKPEIIPPVLIAPARATYTSPQGKNPFNIPISKNEKWAGKFIILLNLLRKNEVTCFKYPLSAILLFIFRGSIKTIRIIRPREIDKYC